MASLKVPKSNKWKRLNLIIKETKSIYLDVGMVRRSEENLEKNVSIKQNLVR